MTWKQMFSGAMFSRLTIAVLILLGGFIQTAPGQVSFQTRYAAVVAKTEADFLEMERRLQFPTPVPDSSARETGEFAFQPAFPRLAAKIDAILDRTSHLLNIRPLPQSRLNIILVENGKEVRRRYLALMPGQRQGLFGFGSLEAYYEVGSRTIYLSLKDLHDGILAHEMAHYLFCTAVFPHPPPDLQESWARYVESRL
jgi:hypothetical protein